MYYSDQPIQDSNGDKLGRKPFAMRVAHAIMDLHSRDCFTVSLQGKWGCGKTSIINMILAEIERTSNDSQIQVIRFNPWNFTDTTQLINQFFVALSSNLKVGNPVDKASRVGEAIEKYSVAFECAKFIPFNAPSLAISANKITSIKNINDITPEILFVIFYFPPFYKLIFINMLFFKSYYTFKLHIILRREWIIYGAEIYSNRND